jgi:hypothetical protein
MRRSGKFRGFGHVVLAAAGALALCAIARAEVNLELRPGLTVVSRGQIVEVGLYAVADDPETVESVAAIQAIISWDPEALQLLGLHQTGATPLIFSLFPYPDPTSVNEGTLPQDGSAYYWAGAPLGAGNGIQADGDGALITTFRFTVRPSAPQGATTLAILAESGNGAHTVVYWGGYPNTPITGTMGTATVYVLRRPRPARPDMEGPDPEPTAVEVIDPEAANAAPSLADTNRDGLVDAQDLINVVLEWGSAGDKLSGDVSQDGVVDGEDLLLVMLTLGASR